MGLSNVRFQFLFFAGVGKVLKPCHNAVTSSFTAGQLPTRYETGVRTRHNEPKAYPTIFTNLCTVLTGDCLSLAHLPDMVTEAP